MNRQIKISHIIVTWNNEEIIEQCIDSLMEYCKDYENEIIVVDNDSKDNTCEVIRRKYGNKVILVDTGVNYGFSKGNNIGLEKATGDYIFFVNPDVIFIEDIITPMLKVFEEREDVGLVSPGLVYEDLSYQVSTCNFPSVKKIIWDDFHLYKVLPEEKQMKYAQAQYKKTTDRYVDWSYGAAHLCKKEDMDRIGAYPEGYFMYGEDTEICMMFLDKLQKKTFYLGSTKLIHIGGYSEKQVLNSRKIIFGTRAAMYFVNKYYGAGQLKGYRILLFMISFIKYILYSLKCLMDPETKNQNGKTKWKASWKTVLNYNGEQN